MKNNTLFNLRGLLAFMLALAMLFSVVACQLPFEPSGGPSAPEPPGSQQPSKGDFPNLGNDNDSSQASPPQIGAVAVRRIDVALDNYEVVLGDSFTPSVVIQPPDATDMTYTLESDDDSVLRQMGDGFIAVGGGTADIIATAANGVVGWASVTVVVPVRSVSLGDGQISLNVGESRHLNPVVYPENASIRQAHFTTSNDNVATVNQNGIIRAIAAGTAVIECTIDSMTVSVTVTVRIPISNISVSSDKRTYVVGDQGSFNVTVSPEGASDKSFSVSISGGGELTGDNTFACTAAGDLVITVTTDDGVSSSLSVSVIDIAAFANDVFNLTNVERANAGLPLFARRTSLTRAAELRAREIIQSFSHTRPDGRSCFTAFDESNVYYRFAGENLAMGQRSPAEVVNGWMDSPGHRENILNENYGHLGIGIVMDSDGVLHWTQTFTD